MWFLGSRSGGKENGYVFLDVLALLVVVSVGFVLLIGSVRSGTRAVAEQRERVEEEISERNNAEERYTEKAFPR